MYAFIVGFDKWVLQAYVKKQKWRRQSARGGWAHGVSGQSDAAFYREYAKGCMAGMGPGTAKLYVVRPEDRGGYMPDGLMSQAIAEAEARGIGVIEVTVP